MTPITFAVAVVYSLAIALAFCGIVGLGIYAASVDYKYPWALTAYGVFMLALSIAMIGLLAYAP